MSFLVKRIPPVVSPCHAIKRLKAARRVRPLYLRPTSRARHRANYDRSRAKSLSSATCLPTTYTKRERVTDNKHDDTRDKFLLRYSRLFSSPPGSGSSTRPSTDLYEHDDASPWSACCSAIRKLEASSIALSIACVRAGIDYIATGAGDLARKEMIGLHELDCTFLINQRIFMRLFEFE